MVASILVFLKRHHSDCNLHDDYVSNHAASSENKHSDGYAKSKVNIKTFVFATLHRLRKSKISSILSSSAALQDLVETQTVGYSIKYNSFQTI